VRINKWMDNTSDSIDRMIATHAFFKTKLCAFLKPNFCRKQYSKTFAMTGLIAMPLKSSQDSGLLTQSFDLGR